MYRREHHTYNSLLLHHDRHNIFEWVESYNKHKSTHKYTQKMTQRVKTFSNEISISLASLLRPYSFLNVLLRLRVQVLQVSLFFLHQLEIDLNLI